MGYVHDTQFSQFIFPSSYYKTAGTWTPSIASNVVKDTRSQADASFSLLIPIPIPSNASALKGCQLKSINIYYAIATAAADDFATVELEKMTLGADDTAITGAAVSAITLDTGHDTAAERLAVDTDHVMTITLTTPAWIDDGEVYYVLLTVDAAATTDFVNFGARANYTLRM